jgi:sugar-specific transcriptional regulator TrmB
MELKEFIELGFNKNEAIVYLSLVKFGTADAHQIIQDTKFHKNIVYDNLEKLMDRGLATYIVEDKRRLFKLASPHMLVDLFLAKQKEADAQKKKAEKLADEIGRFSIQTKSIQDAAVYKGIRGIKSFYAEALEGKDYVVFGAPKRSVDIMGETFWRNYVQKLMERKIHVRMIFNPTLRSYGNSISNTFMKVKYFDKDFEPLTETQVQGDSVGIIVWTDEPILFLIKEKNVALSYLHFFEDMWKKAKP